MCRSWKPADILCSDWLTKKNPLLYNCNINYVRRCVMTKFLVGFLLGVVVATIGFTGVARLLDSGVDAVKEKSQELAR